MKSFKPYLSLAKTTVDFTLDVVLSGNKDQTITSIEQQEVKKNEQAYWGVIITLSSETQVVNGPDRPIFSTTVGIPLEKADKYKTIKCIVQQKMQEERLGPPADEETEIDFQDGNT